MKGYIIDYGENVKGVGDMEAPVAPSLDRAYHLTYIRDWAFDGSRFSNPDITLSSNVKQIGDWSFARSNLHTIKLPKNCEEIGMGVFQGCKDLIFAPLPETILRVYANCYQGTKVDPTRTMHDGLLSVGAYAFADNLNPFLTIILPVNLEVLFERAFSLNGDGKITYDFTRCKKVPKLLSENALGNLDKILVTEKQFGQFGTAPVWSELAHFLEITEAKSRRRQILRL